MHMDSLTPGIALPIADYPPYMTALSEADYVDFSSVSAMDSQSLQFLASVGLSEFAWWPEQTR